ncbi:hypothetical protein EVG20_g6344 [Dentipellis fragilis]|uniref:Enoyl reductase (ER) domain-containing protein n=1 Tax=Dentipellis fragilis TaxID=205917 RepID=A0A4Y9YPD6_9AGAM|nr:hypothetical protein EVG20_g6344 [Dentipellis fragilis]
MSQSALQLPKTQKAAVVQMDATVAVEIIPVIPPGAGEVLVKISVAAQNPTDWKSIDWGRTLPGQGVGVDLAGVIVAVGEGVTNVAVGERVAGWVPAHARVNTTAFREYTIMNARPLIKVPDNVSDEEAATLPVAVATAATGMRRLTNYPQGAPYNRYVLVWGGSSSVGLFAIQLAHLSSSKVITTASPKNHELVKSYGADVAIDYHAPDVVEQIIKATGKQGGVDVVFDAISEGGSVELSAKSLRPNGPRKIGVVLPLKEEDLDPSVEYSLILCASLLGVEVKFFGRSYPRDERDAQFGLEFYEQITGWLRDGRFKGNPCTVWPGGLAGVQDGLAFMKSGKDRYKRAPEDPYHIPTPHLPKPAMSATQIPETQKAAIVQKDLTIAVETIPVASPGAGQVLVKINVAAQNPTDWKSIEWKIIGPGKGTGCDFAGVVAAIGDDVTNVAVGERVAGWVIASAGKTAAFREYTVVDAHPLYKIPDNITDEEASTVPLAIATAAIGLRRLTNYPEGAPYNRYVLVWGGASSVGLFAIQLAHLSSYKVITTASPKNHELVKQYGADVVVDYHAPDVVEQIIKATGKQGANGPRKVTVVLPLKEDELDPSVEYTLTLCLVLLGSDVNAFGRCNPVRTSFHTPLTPMANDHQCMCIWQRDERDYQFGIEFYQQVAGWLRTGQLKGNPYTVQPGGLAGVQDGLTLMKSGKVRLRLRSRIRALTYGSGNLAYHITLFSPGFWHEACLPNRGYPVRSLSVSLTIRPDGEASKVGDGEVGI